MKRHEKDTCRPAKKAFSSSQEQRRHIFANSVDRATVKKLITNVFIPCKCRRLQEQLVESDKRDDDKSNADLSQHPEHDIVCETINDNGQKEEKVTMRDPLTDADAIPEGMFDDDMDEEISSVGQSKGI